MLLAQLSERAQNNKKMKGDGREWRINTGFIPESLQIQDRVSTFEAIFLSIRAKISVDRKLKIGPPCFPDRRISGSK